MYDGIFLQLAVLKNVPARHLPASFLDNLGMALKTRRDYMGKSLSVVLLIVKASAFIFWAIDKGFNHTSAHPYSSFNTAN